MPTSFQFLPFNNTIIIYITKYNIIVRDELGIMIEYIEESWRSFMHQLHLRTYNVHLAVYICTYLCNCTSMYVQSTRAIRHSQCRAEIRQQRNPCRAINFERRKKESSMKTHFGRLNLGRKQAKEYEDAFQKI